MTVFGSFQGRTSLVPGSTATQFSAFAFGNMYTRVEVSITIIIILDITGPAEAKLHWSGLLVQVPECEC